MARKFKDLSEKEILALAITLEEEDGRIYSDFADGLRETFPATAKMFEEMQAEESEHRRSLIEIFRQRFGEHIPLLSAAFQVGVGGVLVFLSGILIGSS
jgi:rubrerythrin